MVNKSCIVRNGYWRVYCLEDGRLSNPNGISNTPCLGFDLSKLNSYSYSYHFRGIVYMYKDRQKFLDYIRDIYKNNKKFWLW